MDSQGRLRINPASLRVPQAPAEDSGSLEIVVPYTGLEMTARVVAQAAALARGLSAKLKLLAVYVAPFPAELRIPTAMQSHLAARLTELAGQTSLPAAVQLVAVRDRDHGFRQVLRPRSVVLLGSPKRPWRTREEKLARVLARDGHCVSLMHFD